MEASNTNLTSSVGEAFIWVGASIRSLFYGMWKGRHFLFSVKNSSYEGKGTQDTPGYRFFRFFSRKLENNSLALQKSGANLGAAGDAPSPPSSNMTCGFLIQRYSAKKISGLLELN